MHRSHQLDVTRVLPSERVVVFSDNSQVRASWAGKQAFFEHRMPDPRRLCESLASSELRMREIYAIEELGLGGLGFEPREVRKRL